MDPFGIYIHWPYCAAKCPYCDFNSHVKRDLSEERYVAAIVSELAFYAKLAPGRTVSSVFFGGGTPSLMEAGTVERILDAIAGHWAVEPAAEITLEANPSSVEAQRFAAFRTAGVNRISIGVQSLRDDQLRFLGRLHNADEARQAIQIANERFERVSFDLIYARPGPSPAEWRAELCEALSLAAGHLSLYQLTIEPDTPFFRLHEAGKLRVPADDDAAALYELTQELCEVAGLPAYEISNHARSGEEARHNLLYWRYGEYAGIGPGAHGRIVTGQGRLALMAERDPAAWAESVDHARVLVERISVGQRGHGLVQREILTSLEEAEELLLMGMRLTEGLSVAMLRGRTGWDLPVDRLTPFVRDGLLSVDKDLHTIAATSAGRLVLNGLISALVGQFRPAPDRFSIQNTASV